MVDHRKRLKYKPTEDAHLFIALLRNKDGNEDIGFPKIYRRLIRHYDEDLAELRAICKERGGIWRIYRTVNKRNFEKANKIFRHKLIDDYDEHFYRLDSLWKTCLLQKESRAEKRFMLDVDTEDEDIINDLENRFIVFGIEVLEKVKSPSGWHYVVVPFDRRQVEDMEEVEVKTDAYIFVEMIDNE